MDTELPTFIQHYSRPTDKQYEAIGRVAANWSVVEFILEGLIARLALAPSFPALALTNNLSVENRMDALRGLVVMHGVRYRFKIVPYDLCEELSKFPAELAILKTRRNKIIHYVWFRMSDENLFGHKFKGKQHVDTKSDLAKRAKVHAENLTDFEDGSSLITTVTDILAFAERVKALGDRMLAAQKRLPEIDEGRLLKSPLLRPRRRRSETQSKRSARRKSSPK